MNINKRPIKHLWFDFSETIAAIDSVEFENLIYTSYAEVVKRDITSELKEEYKELLIKYKSNSAVFASLGLPSGFLSTRAANLNTSYHLTDKNIPNVVKQLKDIIPVSIFSNSKLHVLLPSLGLDLKWFTYILGPDVVKNPKPAPDGFLKMIEWSGVSPEEILYIGDDVDKDLVPAKEVGILTGLLWKESDKVDYCFNNFQDVLTFFKQQTQISSV